MMLLRNERGQAEACPGYVMPPCERIFFLRLRLRRVGGGERHAVGQPMRELLKLLRRPGVFLRLGKCPSRRSRAKTCRPLLAGISRAIGAMWATKTGKRTSCR